MEEYKVIMDLNSTGKSYELLSVSTKDDAVAKINELVSRLNKCDYILPLGRNSHHVTQDDIAFLGVIKNSYPFTSVSYIGIYEGANAHYHNLAPDKKILERLLKEYGETTVAMATAFANLSSYYVKGELVSTKDAITILHNHRMLGYGFYRELCEAVRGSFYGTIRYDFPSGRYMTDRLSVNVVTPSSPSVLLKSLDSYRPPDKYIEPTQVQLDNDYEQAFERYDKIPNEFCAKNLFAHYFIRLDRGIA